MFVTSIILAAVIVTFMSLNIKNRYASVISLYLISITFMLFIATIYISKLHYYHFPLEIDYLLYLRLSTLRIYMSQIIKLYNLGFALFMFSAVYGAKQLIQLKPKFTVLFSLPIFFFLFATPPKRGDHPVCI